MVPDDDGHQLVGTEAFRLLSRTGAVAREPVGVYRQECQLSLMRC